MARVLDNVGGAELGFPEELESYHWNLTYGKTG